MTTRRTFLASLASLAAYAGLARFAGGAVKAAEVAPRIPQRGAPHPQAGMYVTVACAVPDTSGEFARYVVQYRVMRFDERGRLVEVSPAEAR